MKQTCLPGLRYWSVFQPDRGIDFNGFAWQRPDGETLLIDPMPLDEVQLATLESVDWIVLTNADHLRDAPRLAQQLGAKIAAPSGDRAALAAVEVDAWFDSRTALPAPLDSLVKVEWIGGGKTDQEAVLRIPTLDALIFGDAVRSHESGTLRLLPPQKQRDADRLRSDVHTICATPAAAVLLGDGDCIFSGADAALRALVSD